ncbi:MAG: hypothetical protein WCK53_00490 [Methanomicrobiales archaeon]
MPGAITNKQYRELTGMSPRAALRELTDLCLQEIFLKQGTTGRCTVRIANILPFFDITPFDYKQIKGNKGKTHIITIKST